MKIEKDTTKSIISSSISGITSRIILHPIDTLNKRLQIQNKNLLKDVFGRDGLYKNSFDAVKKIIKFEGYRGFYKGMLTSLSFTAPGVSLFLTSYDISKNFLSYKLNLPKEHFTVHFISGFLAESISCIAWVPHDVLKERLQVQRTNEYKFKDIFKIVKKDGLRKLYKGYWITLGTFGPNSACYFLTYEKSKVFLKNLKNSNDLTFKDHLFASTFASSIATIITSMIYFIINLYFRSSRCH